jgi:5-methylcytosine-specific restriction endonuclease McrA
MYPENWNDEIRPRILARDNYKCVSCGIKHRVYVFIEQSGKRIIVDKKEHLELKAEGYRTYRIYLQVSHNDHNKENCKDENLESLCNICHYKKDKEYKKILRLSNV